MSEQSSKTGAVEKSYEVVYLDSPERHFFRASFDNLDDESGEYILENAAGGLVARIPSKNVRYIKKIN